MSQATRIGAPLDGEGLRRKLREHFGFRRFRPGQARAVRAAIEGRDTVVTALHRFFQAGRYPTGEDLVNAHHALKRLASGEGSPTFERLRALSPVPRTRLKQALNLFKARNVVREEAGQIHLLVPDLSMDELHRMAGDYRERDERDRLKQHQLVEFAQTRACRWSYLIDYFGSDDDPGEAALPCGRCDNCRF